MSVVVDYEIVARECVRWTVTDLASKRILKMGVDADRERAQRNANLFLGRKLCAGCGVAEPTGDGTVCPGCLKGDV
jgi:hypothetical protein